MSVVFLSHQDGGSWSPDKRSSLPRHAILSRRGYHDQEDSSTSITSSGSTAPRRPTCKLNSSHLLTSQRNRYKVALGTPKPTPTVLAL